jgi:hypothetical protein
MSRESLRPDYDAADDLSRSVEFAYQHIRERVARGGRGWCGWPEQVAVAPDLLEARRE